MTCKACHKKTDELLAVFWNGNRWHRGCAVNFQKAYISKIEAKLRTSSISQIKYCELEKELTEAREDLRCLVQIYADESKDTQELGKVMVRRGFGKNVDTNKLLESGKITPKQLEKSKIIKELYS